ncbi:MAG: serine/threonine-protein kinase [Pseudomonadota bacterium]
MRSEPSFEHTWAEISKLLDQAFDVPAAERSTWVRQTCADRPELQAELESLLAADKAAEAMFTTGESIGGADGLTQSISLIGSQVGPYELLEPIGQGGMGQVFLAQRIEGDFEQRVAIKLLPLQLNEDARRRFQSECEHLARLDHPHIVRLLDAGIAQSGVSYLVLQLVEGQTLDHWSAGSGASLRQRMQLFAQLCEAVIHAHQNLVVHRDIKPANVLITQDGAGQIQAKLLDFGISRHLEDDRTATASAMTPRFAAPEQLQGQSFTTRTDVYGLGVVLHVLLTGLPPYADHDLSLTALAERSRRREPSLPSGLPADEAAPVPRRQLRGDLDAVMLKCLQTEPGDRYESALALRDDARAWLTGREVRARRPSAARRLLRLARRNRWQTGVTFALLLVAAGAASYHWRALNAERDEAVATSDFLVNLMADINPYRRSADDALVIPLSEFYVAGLDALDGSAISPAGQSKLAVAFSQGLYSIDAAQESLAAAEKALGWTAGRPAQLPAYHRALQQRALALTSLRRFDEAKTDFRELLSQIGQAVPKNSVWAATLSLQYANCLVDAGDVAASLDYYSAALEVLPTENPTVETKSHTLSALMSQAGARSRLGHHVAARRSSDRQIELARAWFGENHIEFVRALGQAVTVRKDGSQNEFAEKAYRAAERVLGPTHSETLSMHNNFALRLAWQDRNEESVEQFHRLIAIRAEAGLVAGDPHQNLAATLRSMKRFDEAWEQTELARQAYAANLGSRHWRLAMPLITQADMALSQDQPGRAYERAVSAAKLLDASLGSEHYAARVARALAMAGREALDLCTPLPSLLSEAQLEQTAKELRQNGREVLLAHLEQGAGAEPCP